MRGRRALRRALPAIALVVALGLPAAACRPEMLVRLATVVYEDGSVERRVEIRGRDAEGELPEEREWLGQIGLRFAEPDAWSRVERRPGLVRADGFFASAAELPPVLAHETDGGERAGRMATRLEIEERVVLKRWLYAEEHGDPYGEAEVAAALDALAELAVEALEGELRRQLGRDLDTSRVGRFVREEGRALAVELLDVRRELPQVESFDERALRWIDVLGRRGMRAAPAVEGGFWEAQLPVLMEWTRARIALVLSSSENEITPDSLAFWPMGDDAEEGLTALAERAWGDEETAVDLLEPHLSALSGYYGDDGSPRFRFESRLRLPGTLLRTNGTPDGDSVVWVFRDRDIAHRDEVLTAEAVAPLPEPLRKLGARRDFDRSQLLRLADLLWRRDPHGELTELLAGAVHSGRLEDLRDPGEASDDLKAAARELAELLDPDVPSLPPL